ncbi:hypothetical protein DGo_CA1441 [Deinococcus gobiensis I-0]|uniref:Uncharacterized protein n=1 Tax=Deinococcus gobiensis (strain DSM 21396 / JCM 16679 / CGMCC 1.7299 / I-0) TaxID=745776 RepID=H8GTP0_DEIGI|nr:hypothetical protein DGo_CA1441 [Deinococcus gobiensis I-0]
MIKWRPHGRRQQQGQIITVRIAEETASNAGEDRHRHGG